MSGRGRPLRFLLVATGSWVGLRVFMLWPAGPLGVVGHRLAPVANAAIRPRSRRTATPRRNPLSADNASRLAIRRPNDAPEMLPWPRDPASLTLALVGLIRFGEPQVTQPARRPILTIPPPVALPPTPVSRSRPPSRWSGSTWLVVRGGSGSGAGFAQPELGGAQAGARIAYMVDRRRRVAAVGRIASPLSGRGREAALGIEWQPTRAPVRLVAEERVSLDGGRSGPSAGVIAGVGPVPVGGGFDLEAYGQAGAVDRDRVEGFADGAAKIAHRLVRIGKVQLDLGGGAWGAAQRGARRLDLGSSLGATIPIDARSMRLSLDWRQRVAGNARPGSGIALTLGADF